MKSLKELYIKGPGPSSSHTIGPYKASLAFINEIKDKKDFNKIVVTLYGSLGLLADGHGTDKILLNSFKNFKNVEILHDIKSKVSHPNTLKFALIDDNNNEIYNSIYQSIGGGAIKKENEKYEPIDVYPFNNFEELKENLRQNNSTDLYSLIQKYENIDIFEYTKDLVLHSFSIIEEGLSLEGVLPGKLKLKIVAKEIFNQALKCSDLQEKKNLLISSFAYATCEANAQGKQIVTAPTCGSSGVMPALLYYEYKYEQKELNDIVKAYLVGGLFGDVIKENASISGACHGCQAEVGSASSMAAASLCYLNNLSLYQIEYAAEVAMEHFLGLTCDPVEGYVQIPCIERNAMASIHAYTAYLYAKNIAPLRKNVVSFDNVVKAMKETGNDLNEGYRETGKAGLASIIK